MIGVTGQKHSLLPVGFLTHIPLLYSTIVVMIQCRFTMCQVLSVLSTSRTFSRLTYKLDIVTHIFQMRA